MEQHVDLVPLFRRELELCNLREGEVVCLLAEPATRRAYVEAAASAAASLGAEVLAVSVPGLGWGRIESRSKNMQRGNAQSIRALVDPSPLRAPVRGAVLASDFVVDLIPESIALVQFREELQAAGKRILTCHEPPDVLERMFPTSEIRDSVVAMREAFSAARELRATSPWGTEIGYDISAIKGIGQYGYADVPGKWDNWPSGLVNVWPRDGSGEGVQVLSPGDVLFPFKRYVESPVTIVVEGGFITSIEGGFDARLLREYLESWEDPEVYGLAHASIGMHPRAQWTSLPFYDTNEHIGMEGRSVRGAWLFTTGPNRFVQRWVQPHYDIGCLGHTVYLDGEAVVRDGKVVLREAVMA